MFRLGIMKRADEIVAKMNISPEVNDLDGLTAIAFKIEMDLKNTTKSLEEVALMNPMDPKNSLKEAFEEFRILDFYT
jgi:hypothetical protein